MNIPHHRNHQILHRKMKRNEKRKEKNIKQEEIKNFPTPALRSIARCVEAK